MSQIYLQLRSGSLPADRVRQKYWLVAEIMQGAAQDCLRCEVNFDNLHCQAGRIWWTGDENLASRRHLGRSGAAAVCAKSGLHYLPHRCVE